VIFWQAIWHRDLANVLSSVATDHRTYKKFIAWTLSVCYFSQPLSVYVTSFRDTSWSFIKHCDIIYQIRYWFFTSIAIRRLRRTILNQIVFWKVKLGVRGNMGQWRGFVEGWSQGTTAYSAFMNVVIPYPSSTKISIDVPVPKSFLPLKPFSRLVSGVPILNLKTFALRDPLVVVLT